MDEPIVVKEFAYSDFDDALAAVRAAEVLHLGVILTNSVEQDPRDGSVEDLWNLKILQEIPGDGDGDGDA